MTGLIGLAKTLALTALGASGLLMAGGQFTASGPANVSFESSAPTTTGADTGQASTVTIADSSSQSEVTPDPNDCLDNCLAPCAAACADPQRPPLDGAVQQDAAFGAAVAPEHPAADASVGFDASAASDIGVAGNSPTAGLGASSSGFGGFGVE